MPRESVAFVFLPKEVEVKVKEAESQQGDDCGGAKNTADPVKLGTGGVNRGGAT